MTNQYGAGRAREYKVRDLLIAEGYDVVRSAGSKGAIDLVAIKAGQILFVQVKTTTPPGPASWNKLYDLASHVGAVPVLATCAPRMPIRLEVLTARKEKAGRSPLAPFIIDQIGEATP